MVSLWNEISTKPKNHRVFIAKGFDQKEFPTQYAPLPDGLGYYGYLKLVGYKDKYSTYTIEEWSQAPTHWRELE